MNAGKNWWASRILQRRRQLHPSNCLRVAEQMNSVHSATPTLHGRIDPLRPTSGCTGAFTYYLDRTSWTCYRHPRQIRRVHPGLSSCVRQVRTLTLNLYDSCFRVRWSVITYHSARERYAEHGLATCAWRFTRVPELNTCEEEICWPYSVRPPLAPAQLSRSISALIHIHTCIAAPLRSLRRCSKQDGGA